MVVGNVVFRISRGLWLRFNILIQRPRGEVCELLHPALYLSNADPADVGAEVPDFGEQL